MGRVDDELRRLRLDVDRRAIERAMLLEKLRQLEEENEALRNMVATITTGGISARL